MLKFEWKLLLIQIKATKETKINESLQIKIQRKIHKRNCLSAETKKEQWKEIDVDIYAINNVYLRRRYFSMQLH